MTTLTDASRRQNEASTPGNSTWLLANAGSGKTRVLTDRVARLLLQGADPQGILCLTFTKAAASEMQNRLFDRLGKWSMQDDASLRQALGGLGETGPLDLNHARTLFARAIETPGGLKIQTIHAFCGALLRKFPIEAGVAPGFVEIDETQQSELAQEALDHVAETAPEVFDAFAPLLSDQTIAEMLAKVISKREELGALAGLDSARAALGLASDVSVMSTAFDGSELGVMPGVLSVLSSTSAAPATVEKMRVTLAPIDWAHPTEDDLGVLSDLFLYASGSKENANAPKFNSMPPKKVQEELGALLGPLQDLMQRVADAKDAQLAVLAAERTAALHALAKLFLARYEEMKTLRGWLDFDDLILKARALLSDPSVAAWVLYRLDGGIDHVLIDEAQDTSPAQWDLIRLLTEEIGAGEGTRSDLARSFFVVGDKKQSIYSFQGADADGFDDMFGTFRRQLLSTTGLQALQLEHSFRSSPAILRVVDATFPEGHPVHSRHTAFHDRLPGRVDLWPLVPKAEETPDRDFRDPVDRIAPNHEAKTLAQRIASEVDRLVKIGTRIPTPDGDRPMTAGDVLILVQGRGPLFVELIRALKSQGLPVAGADRLKIGDELAVKDVLSLLRFLTLPEDSLSLAEALRSPLFGWSEDDLFRLAAQREEEFLWATLRNRADHYPKTMAILDDLRGQVDFLRPYELIERILARHDGRYRLMSRLGPEIQDALDELVHQAMAYEASSVPSLTGFVSWMDGQDFEIKREIDTDSNTIRVMTVHGAKGLEAPIVILPDTLRTGKAAGSTMLPDDSANLLVIPPSKDRPSALRGLVEADRAADRAERERLLYVAMTRAETWLIVCGAGGPSDLSATWYGAVGDGMDRVEATDLECPTGTGTRFELSDWPDSRQEDAKPATSINAPPAWAFETAPPEPPRRPTLSPSDLDGAKALPGQPADADPMRYGRMLHLLLEHLPETPPDRWDAVAPALLAASADTPFDGEVAGLLEDARKVIEAPSCAHVFQAGLAEVPITAEVPEFGARLEGIIDRLIVEDDRVLVVDFKSNAAIPTSADQVPDGILRQMGAYSAALAQIYPGKPIETAILWTRGPVLMPLTHDIVMNALQSTATS